MSHLLEPQLKRSKYRLLGLIGRGQFGRVYCALHRQTGQLVALKALDHDRSSTHKFLRELRFLLALQHPNIVTCTTLEHQQRLRYLVMDYCEGGTLRNLMEDHRLHPAMSVRLILDVLAGIDHAHRHNIVHCDIKPENILLNLKPGGWTARISDFGIAQMTQELMGEGFGVTGSPAYMAPERFYGQNSPSCDLYAIGVLLFELLTGDRPFSGAPLDLMSAHLNQAVKIPDSMPLPLKTIVLTALQKLKARRFSSASQMAIALKSAVEICPELQVKTVLMPSAKASAESTLPLSRFHIDRRENRREQLGKLIEVMKLVEPLQELVVRPQGCFAVTARSLYLLKDHPQPILRFSQPSLVTIEPQGRWAATIDLQKPINSLNICHFSDSTILSSSLPTADLFELLALDSRHLVALSHRSDLNQGTLLEFFTRRRQAIGRLELAVNLEQVLLGSSPNSLIATELDHPQSILIIDLKPLKLTRVAIEITPRFLAATSWGYVLVNHQGQMILLDREGRTYNCETALINLCAIAPFGKFGLLLSTWDGQQGTLFMINLEQIVNSNSDQTLF